MTGPNGVGLSDLGTLGGTGSTGMNLNIGGQVVGFSHVPGNTAEHAFFGSISTGITDLGTLGGNDSVAVDINSLGMVVGWSLTSSGKQHAFVTGAGGTGMFDLNDLVTLPGGAYLQDARGINDSGQIIAIANGHSFVLTPMSPIPEPDTYALMLTGLAVTAWTARKRSS